ncbi:MAG: MATE family efflux transporter [Bacillota bacterium]
MTTAVKKENKMGTEEIKTLLFHMAWPLMVSMVIQALYNTVDSMFVARISENALTAVSLAYPMQNLIIAVSVGTGVGVNALISKSLGAKNVEFANKVASVNLFLAVAIWVVFVFVGIFLLDPFIAMQTDDPEIFELAKSYLQICVFASFGLCMQVATEKLLQSTGKTMYNMYGQCTGAIANIILDPILIFGMFGVPAMGIKGAAYATVLSQFLSCCIGLYFNFKKNKEIAFSVNKMLPTFEILQRIFSIGLPSILMMSLGSVMIFVINAILATFTPTAVAVYGVCFKLQNLCMMPVFGLNNAIIPIIAYNYGAKNYERITATVRLGVLTAITFMTTGMLFYLTFPEFFLLMFDASEDMLEIGVPALRTISICFVTAAHNISCSAVFQSLQRGKYSLAVSVARQAVILMPMAYLLSLTGNLRFVWFAFPLSEVIAFIACFVFIRKVLRVVKGEMVATEIVN